MKKDKPVLDKTSSSALAKTSIYVVSAAIVFAWLTIRASNGALFSEAKAAYHTSMPAAPGIQPHKTEVLSESGVPVGVVTGVRRSQAGARVDLKITGPMHVRKGASTKIVVRNIIGERAVMITNGARRVPAQDGSALTWRDHDAVSEPSDALEGVEDARQARKDPEVQAFLDKQEVVLAAARADTLEVVEDSQVLANMLSAQQVALTRINRRTNALLDVLAAKHTSAERALASSAALAQDAAAVLDDSLTVAEHGLELVANTAGVLSRRRAEIDYTLARLPEIAADFDHANRTILRLLRNERGAFVYLYWVNLPDMNKVLEALKTP